MSQEVEMPPEITYAYMCGKCVHIYSSIEDVKNHDCRKDLGSKDGDVDASDYVTAELVEIEDNAYMANKLGTTLVVNEKGRIEYDATLQENEEIYQIQPAVEEYEIMEFDNPLGTKRKRNNKINDYVMNKLVRDPYFKLDRNSYTFKDTLGDWSENSTRLLIKLIGKYPKAHFLLQYYYERRLSHWEQIHSCMVAAGYNFTVLQLRMRWREVFAKYRWTLNHNDIYEDKKTFEYMKEMDDLFGIWTYESTSSLLTLIEQIHNDGASSRPKRLGFLCWERITESLNQLSYCYTIIQVEARWRMLVTTYKSMLDHNIMPTVQPISAAFSDQLRNLVIYEPRRRKDYEKYKGKRVKLEKFPEDGMKHVIQLYKDSIAMFIDPTVNNADVWEGIQESLAAFGYPYHLSKIKEIFFATLKLYERVLQHNSIPGAIKREGPHFKELSEIYNQYGFWPHVMRKRKTLDEKQKKKFKLMLRESMQTWRAQETKSLLFIYPQIIENFNGIVENDFWVQIAHSFMSLGFQKRDTTEIATHTGLLRQGYIQGNNFPFSEEMQRIMEVEKAMHFSPSVSKYTGDVQILYWSHEAVLTMLDLYLKIQPLIPISSMSKEVYGRIAKEMSELNYRFTCEEIEEEFRALLLQFSGRRYKSRRTIEERSKAKTIPFCREKMIEVLKLRERLAVSFSNGIKPVPEDIVEIVLKTGLAKIKEVFSCPVMSYNEQKRSMVHVVHDIRKQIKKVAKKKAPSHRKICLELLSLLSDSNPKKCFKNTISAILNLLSPYDYEDILTTLLTEMHGCSLKLPDVSPQPSDGVEEEGEMAYHQTICIYNESKNFKDRSLTPQGSLSWEQVIPKVELIINEEMEEEKNCKFYIDSVNKTKTTVYVNHNSEVMISIDDIKEEPEDEYDMGESKIEVNEKAPFRSEGPDMFDSDTLLLLFKTEAHEASDEEKKMLSQLNSQQEERCVLFRSLLQHLNDTIDLCS